MGETLLLHATRYGYVQQSIFDAATTQIASQQQQQQQVSEVLLRHLRTARPRQAERNNHVQRKARRRAGPTPPGLGDKYSLLL